MTPYTTGTEKIIPSIFRLLTFFFVKANTTASVTSASKLDTILLVASLAWQTAAPTLILKWLKLTCDGRKVRRCELTCIHDRWLRVYDEATMDVSRPTTQQLARLTKKVKQEQHFRTNKGVVQLHCCDASQSPQGVEELTNDELRIKTDEICSGCPWIKEL